MHTQDTSTGAGELIDLVRMSHTTDPDTSHDAAKRAKRGTKVVLLQGAILATLAYRGPLTAKEIHADYAAWRGSAGWLPAADLQDIRRRLTELKLDQQRVVDTGTRRNGESVVAHVGEVAA